MSTDYTMPLPTGGITESVRQAQDSQFGWADLTSSDLSWVADTAGKYRSVLRKLPRVFAWVESIEFFRTLRVAQQSTAFRRLQSCFHHISLYDSSLAQAMEETFRTLPLEGKLRFMTAPETYRSISLLRSEPSLSVMKLSTFLNGEAVFQGLGSPKSGYYTALGDVYYCGSCESEPENYEKKSSEIRTLLAPCLVDRLPIDFFSPNVQHAKETSGSKEDIARLQYGDYSSKEILVVVEKLQDTFSRIEKVSEAAAQLVRQFVKVIIPFKIPAGGGSTSQIHFPGRILLSGIENVSPTRIASMLVHEAMHQLLYILEGNFRFVIEPAEHEETDPTVKSFWTGRDLQLHSFIHACFIWYGLAKFWTLPKASEVFEPKDLEIELTRSFSGFKGRNPIEAVEPFAGRLRYDVVAIAGTLQGLLEPINATVTTHM